jgi:hypothetical protein
MAGFPVRIDAPAGVSLFAYDNHTFVVESFLDHETEVTAELPTGTLKLHNLMDGQTISPAAETTTPGGFGRERQSPPARFRFPVKAHSFLAFKYE